MIFNNHQIGLAKHISNPCIYKTCNADAKSAHRYGCRCTTQPVSQSYLQRRGRTDALRSCNALPLLQRLCNTSEVPCGLGNLKVSSTSRKPLKGMVVLPARFSKPQSSPPTDKASYNVLTRPETDEPQTANENGQDETKNSFSKIWIPVALYITCYFALCFAIAYALDGYKAINDDSARSANGTLKLRPSDFNTLISMATSIIAYLVDSYAGIAVWTCALTLLRTTGLTAGQLDSVVDAPSQLSWIIQDGWPAPWIRQGKVGWFAASAVLLLFPQAFIEMVITGAVDWKPSVDWGPTVQVRAAEPRADISNWYWYLSQETTRKGLLRVAGGNAAIGWADTGNFIQRRSLLRNVVNDDNLPVNSTITDAILPVLMAHNITVVGDAPFLYDHAGNAIVFDPDDTKWTSSKYIVSNSSQANVPPASRFSGNKKVVLMLARQKSTTPACSPVTPDTFGDLSYFKNVFPLVNANDQNCFISGTINMTAGVVRKRGARYISSRVVDSEDPWSVDDIQSDRWVEEAIRLLPDVMAFVSQLNASSMPTWNNVDDYVASLVQQSFMGAWSALSRTNDASDILLTANPAILRSQAVVSRARAFAWLGATLLIPVSTIITTYLQRRYLDKDSLSANSRAATLLLSPPGSDGNGILSIPLEPSHSAAEEKRLGT
ncbi:hypothetical protein V496_06627 [Pseudogymnoascus sp. VKM F-4515 (FW-2607)]|nr:hypothetical protein V496_06627 [Pseudogymnoascus sp. VKM F-4515 (FW-2607)]